MHKWRHSAVRLRKRSRRDAGIRFTRAQRRLRGRDVLRLHLQVTIGSAGRLSSSSPWNRGSATAAFVQK